MSDRFDMFTERARKVLQLAQEEARRFNHNYIGTEHILLGLVREEYGVAGRLLRNLGVDLREVRSQVKTLVSQGERIVAGDIGLTPRAKRVIELAVDEARRLKHHYVGTEHLLLGLARYGEGMAATIFESLGVPLEEARLRVLVQWETNLTLIGGGVRQVDGGLLEDGKEANKKRGRRRWRLGRWLLGSRRVPRAGRKATRRDVEMPDRFDKFTERARKVLQLAQEEAQRFNHNYMGTEHILLGLVREGDGVAARVLSNLGIELAKVRAAVEFIIGHGDRMAMGEIGLTPRAKRVIELSVDEARRLDHHYIGTEHILLGLVREGEGIAAGVLESLGVSLEKVRREVIAVLQKSSGYVSAEPERTVEDIGDNVALDQIRTMFDYSLWARDKLIGAVRTLDDTDLKESEYKGVYGSIHDTLAHMAVSEWLWIRRCRGESPMYMHKGEDFTDLDALVEWWDSAHREAMEYLSQIQDADLDMDITYKAPDGKTRTRKVWHMLLQVTNHQTEHRAQIGTMLGQLGVEVPPTDLVVYLSEMNT